MYFHDFKNLLVIKRIKSFEIGGEPPEDYRYAIFRQDLKYMSYSESTYPPLIREDLTCFFDGASSSFFPEDALLFEADGTYRAFPFTIVKAGNGLYNLHYSDNNHLTGHIKFG